MFTFSTAKKFETFQRQLCKICISNLQRTFHYARLFMSLSFFACASTRIDERERERGKEEGCNQTCRFIYVDMCSGPPKNNSSMFHGSLIKVGIYKQS